MTDLRADSMTGEQWVLEERTADPTSTEEGERWLRGDLNSGDKIATLRVDVGASILDVPVFSAGSAVDVSEAMRVQVNGTTGYVPLAPISDATYPELRMQHAGATYGFHDAVELSAIPDSVVNNLDIWHPMDEGSGSTLADSQDTQDASLNGSAAWESNDGWGDTSPDLDGADDWWRSDAQVSPSAGSTILTWFRPDTISENGGLIGLVDDPQSPSNGYEAVFVSSQNRTGSATFDGGDAVGTGGVSGIDTADAWYFLGVTADYSSGDVTQYLYDNTQQLGTNTQTGSIGETTSHLYGGLDALNGVYLDGNVDAAGARLDAQLSESTIEQIWQDTQR